MTDFEDSEFAYHCRALLGWLLLEASPQHHPPRRYPDVAPPEAGSCKPLIVLLHGYVGAPIEFNLLAHDLQAALGERFDFALVDTLDPLMEGSPVANVRRLDDYLARNDLQSRNLYFICHSLGGLIARCYTYKGTAAARVRALVMIGTPNGGVKAWGWFPIHWMRSDGFDARFNAMYPPKADIQYQLLVGTKGDNNWEGQPNDRVVGCWSVEALCKFPGAINVQVHYYPLDHWELLYDERVAKVIVEFLSLL